VWKLGFSTGMVTITHNVLVQEDDPTIIFARLQKWLVGTSFQLLTFLPYNFYAARQFSYQETLLLAEYLRKKKLP